MTALRPGGTRFTALATCLAGAAAAYGGLTPEQAVWRELPAVGTGEATKGLRAELARTVEEMAAAGHLAPARFYKGHRSRSSGEWYWHSPSELVCTLSLALPYLPKDAKTKAIRYMKAEMQARPPLGVAASDGSGKRRERFPVSPKWQKDSPPHRGGVGIDAAYALWLYARNTGDWGYLRDRWSRIKSAYEGYLGKKREAPGTRYPEIGGLIGLARIARKLGHEETAGRAAADAARALGENRFQAVWKREKERITFETRWNWVMLPVFVADLESAPFAVRLFFPREVGLYLRSREEDRKAVKDIVQAAAEIMPLWHLTQSFTPIHGECTYAAPDVSWSLFMMRAYVLGDSREDLMDLLDTPNMLGDLCYIQKLVAAIEAPSLTDGRSP